MNYELVLVPMDYKKHILPKNNQSTCTLCSEELVLIDEFLNDKHVQLGSTEFEGIFSICAQCGTPHLELVDGDVDFKGPVLISW